jgi:hypothetical protein
MVKRLLVRTSEITFAAPGDVNPVTFPIEQVAAHEKVVPGRSACKGKLLLNPEQMVSFTIVFMIKGIGLRIAVTCVLLVLWQPLIESMASA